VGFAVVVPLSTFYYIFCIMNLMFLVATLTLPLVPYYYVYSTKVFYSEHESESGPCPRVVELRVGG
jgi:hypothetical protein